VEYAEADALNSAIRALSLRHRARAGELLARLNLHPGQEFVLMELAAHGPRIQAQLADAIACEPPSITLMVRKLESAGYVERRPSPQDGRATIVELTASGRDLTATLRDLWITLAKDTMADLDEPSVNDIAAVLAALADNLSRRAAAARAAT
jgi:DNA-binding MarR family transcriptional regulator